MKRTTGITIAAAIAALGTASFAATMDLPEAFGPTTAEFVLDDARLHAETLFAKVDVDQDGVVSIDEYASQAVVLASLSRFNGTVVIDGAETFNLALPEEVTTPIGAVEQTAIDAVARAEFYQIAGDDRSIDETEWVGTKLREFAEVDFDENGVLEGAELDVFAMNIARYQITLS